MHGRQRVQLHTTVRDTASDDTVSGQETELNIQVHDKSAMKIRQTVHGVGVRVLLEVPRLRLTDYRATPTLSSTTRCPCGVFSSGRSTRCF